MKILIATSNPHKLDEIRAVIGDASVELVSLGMLPGAGEIAEPVEDQDTFEGNAELKARYYAKATGMLCLADDSGLEVDALNGEPGVRSARYSNTDGPRAERDAANSLALLKNLGDVSIDKRAARFVCVMALVDGREANDELVAVFRGTLEGRILTAEEADDPVHPERGRGSNGFGYDPIVYVSERNKTVAELSSDEKNAISHRGDAVRKVWPSVIQQLGMDLYFGKTALVGFTYLNQDTTIQRRTQVYGKLIGLNEFGWLQLKPSDGGEDVAVPPNLELARPGEYRLKSSGNVVIDPDYIGTWTVAPPNRDDAPRGLWFRARFYLATLPGRWLRRLRR